MALCRLAATGDVPAWATSAAQFLCIVRTPSELSIVADERAVPPDADASRGYRLMRVEGPLQLDLVGILAALAAPLAEAHVPIFPIATYDTDYILVRAGDIQVALEALAAAGHFVRVSAQGPTGNH